MLICKDCDFNPRPPWGGRLTAWLSFLKSLGISIHALRGEGDQCARGPRCTRKEFQSTPSVGRATACSFDNSDNMDYFNPRPPWGGRQALLLLFFSCRAIFQSTPSVGRATVCWYWMTSRQKISIHALRGEGDTICITARSCLTHFNPRPPWGGRRESAKFAASGNRFQSTPSVGRATILSGCVCQ